MSINCDLFIILENNLKVILNLFLANTMKKVWKLNKKIISILKIYEQLWGYMVEDWINVHLKEINLSLYKIDVKRIH